MASPLIVDLATFRGLSTMPRADVDRFEADNPGWLAARSAVIQAGIEARLSKRYAMPFKAGEAPPLVVRWIVDMLTLDAYVRRGYNPSLAELAPMQEQAKRALDEVLEAANSETGLFDLPLAAGGSAVVSGGPMGYSETSPYVHTDIERQIAGNEDTWGHGS